MMKFMVPKGPLPPGRSIVVTLDICSSSDVLEDLSKNGATNHYTDLLGNLKRTLASCQSMIQQRANVTMSLYKFTGDGWILLIPAELQAAQARKLGKSIVAMMRRLSRVYKSSYSRLEKHLDSPPNLSGINFGLDVGELKYTMIYQRDEFIGRAINVACRLQGAIKDKDKKPAYKALVTRAVFNNYLSPAIYCKFVEVTRKLRNINADRPIRCVKIDLLKSN